MEKKLLVAAVLVSLVFPGCALNSSEAWQSSYEKPAGRTRGVKAVAVVVELSKPPGSSQEMNRNQLQKDMETKIRQAGVTVVAQKSLGDLPNAPLVYLNVKIARIDEMYGYNIDIICMNAPHGRPLPAKLANCNLETSGLVREIALVREKVADLVNLFIKDYLLDGAGTPKVSWPSPGPGQGGLRLTVPPA